MKTFLIYTFSALLLLLSACNKDKIPGVYRIDIQQGNDVTQEMINKLRPDMTKSQVAYVMGTPLLIDTFHPNRWDYIYSLHPGNSQREQRQIVLFFTDEEKLSHIKGNIRTVSREDLPQNEQHHENNVVVPLNKKKTGFFQGILNTVGLGSDEQEIYEEAKEKVVTPDIQGRMEAENEQETMGPDIGNILENEQEIEAKY